MPEINFGQLRRAVQADYAALGTPISKREAELITSSTINEGNFKQWLASIDQDDADHGLTDIDGHSDTTARAAIKRALRAHYNSLQVAA